MPKIGGIKFCYAVITTADTPEKPAVYSELKEIGPFVTANMTTTNAKGEIYGDDIVQEMIETFVNAVINGEVTDMFKKTAAELLGAEYEETTKEIKHKAGDVAPDIGVAFIAKLLRGGKLLFEPHVFTKAKFAKTTENAQTKNNQIQFGTYPFALTCIQPKHAETAWHYEAEFDNEAAAVDWIKKKLPTTAG